MGQFTIKLPDVGEGVAEAELVEWMVEEGQNVREDEVLAAVMTDKATVEIPSPVEGKITWRGASLGDVVAVGSPIIRLEVEGEGNVSDGPADETQATSVANTKLEKAAEPDKKKLNGHSAPVAPAEPVEVKTPSAAAISKIADTQTKSVLQGGLVPAGVMPPRAEGEKPLASPAVRLRAREAGIDLRTISGSGGAGRIIHEDLDRVLQQGSAGSMGVGVSAMYQANTSIEEIPVIGLRRKIAEKMATSKSRIPHITYVDEIDMTALEELRVRLNKSKRDDQPKLTILPFLMRAMVRALRDHPQINAIYDDEAGIVHQHGGIHMGVATQTPNGLIVPVVRHAEARSIWGCAEELMRLADAARDGKASRDELSGSTITITSLGAMGGIVTTPVINHPEVAIIGVNKMQVKPVWDGQQFVPKKVMNLSSSFDHRVIDGWDCAVFIQGIKALLESPAEIFIDD